MSKKEKKTEFYDFGNFRLKRATRRLLGSDGKVILISPKSFDLLLLLAQNSGEILTKEDLLNKIWGGEYVEENNLTVRIAEIRKAIGENRGENVFIQTIHGHGYCFVAKVKMHSEIGPPETETRNVSLAVLPIANESGDPNFEYLCDGVTESIINNLSQSKQIRVISHNTVSLYKNKTPDLQTIGQELDISKVLVGRLYKVDEQLSLSIELINIKDKSQIWGARFAHLPSNLLETQEAIANKISDILLLKLSGSEKKLSAQRQTKNGKAYLSYLKGRYFWNKRGIKDIEKAISYFETAIENDPDYALAYTGLADCYCMLSSYGFTPLRDIAQKAERAVSKALELDETSAEAFTSAAYLSSNFDRNWQKAEREYRRAIELNPNYMQAHFWLASLLSKTGRFDEAILQIKQAQKIDPLSIPSNRALAKILYLARRYDEAIKKCYEILEINPNFGPANGLLGMIYRDKKMYKEALQEVNKLIEFSIAEYNPPEQNGKKPLSPSQKQLIFAESDPEATALAGQVYALNGEKNKALKVIKWLEDLSALRYVEPHAIALVYAGLGNKDKAFEYLEKSIADSSAILTYFKVWSFLDPLRSDPRFDDLLQRIGFE